MDDLLSMFQPPNRLSNETVLSVQYQHLLILIIDTPLLTKIITAYYNCLLSAQFFCTGGTSSKFDYARLFDPCLTSASESSHGRCHPCQCSSCIALAPPASAASCISPCSSESLELLEVAAWPPAAGPRILPERARWYDPQILELQLTPRGLTLP